MIGFCYILCTLKRIMMPFLNWLFIDYRGRECVTVVVIVILYDLVGHSPKAQFRHTPSACTNNELSDLWLCFLVCLNRWTFMSESLVAVIVSLYKKKQRSFQFSSIAQGACIFCYLFRTLNNKITIFSIEIILFKFKIHVLFVDNSHLE